MARHVTIIDTERVTYVKGWLTGGTDPGDGSVECGDGTLYPMLVTPDQLAEIAYRVKQADFTSGEAFAEYDLGNLHPQVNTTPRSDENFEYRFSSLGDLIEYSGYGYFYHYEEVSPLPDPIPDENNPLSDERYSGLLGAAYTYPISGDSFYTGEDIKIRDALSDELVIYDPSIPDNELIGGTSVFVVSLGLGASFGFRHSNTYDYFTDDAPSAAQTMHGIKIVRDAIDPLPGGDDTANIGLTSDLSVAFIDTTGSGNPLDPGNSLYLQISFDILGDATLQRGISSFKYDDAITPPLGSNLVFALANGVEVSCPLYADVTELTWTSSSDFVMTAVEWWPYAKDIPATPAWDSSTGVKL